MLLLATACSSKKVAIPDLERDALKKELQEIKESDQQCRRAAAELRRKNNGLRTPEEDALWSEQVMLDSLNMVRVEQIMAKYGYPGRSLAGEDLKSVCAFVIIHNPESQEKYLDVLWTEAKKGNIDKREIAVLEDRINMLKGKKQQYGTAMKSDTVSVNTADGQVATRLRIWDIADFKNLDKKREKVGWYSLKLQCELSEIDCSCFMEYKHQTNKYDFDYREN